MLTQFLLTIIPLVYLLSPSPFNFRCFSIPQKEAVEANLSQWQEKFRKQTTGFQEHSTRFRAEKQELNTQLRTVREELEKSKEAAAAATAGGGANAGLTQALTADLNRVRQEKGAVEARLRVLEDQLSTLR